MIKQISLVTVVITAAALVIGCGGSDEDQTNDNGGTGGSAQASGGSGGTSKGTGGSQVGIGGIKGSQGGIGGILIGGTGGSANQA
jgi:hypothetical protein